MRLAVSSAAVLLLLAASAAVAVPQEEREITVRVVDASGGGIPGAWVRPVRQIGDEWFERTTDAAGEVRARAGELSRFAELCIGAPGFKCRHVPAREFLPAEGSDLVSVPLEQASTRIRIRVQDEGGAPLPGKRVVAKCAPRNKRRGSPDAAPAPAERVSDPSGVADFLGLAPGEWEFDIAEPGLVRKARAAAPVREGQAVTHDLKLVVRAEPRLRGVLLDNAFDPVPGAAVRRLPRGEQVPAAEEPAVTDSHGRFSLREGPTGGPWRLEVRLADGRVLEIPEVYDTPDERPWVLDVPPKDGEQPHLRGRVVGASGRGVRAWVSVRAADAESAAKPLAERGTRPDGTFEIYRLPPGRLRLGARFVARNGTIPRGGPAAALDVDTGSGESVEIRIPAGEPISGRLVDPEGRPAAGVHLVARQVDVPEPGHFLPAAGPPPGAPGGNAVTEADGSFLIENLAHGRYRFTAASKDSRGLLPWIVGDENVVDGAAGVVLSYGPDRPIRGRAMSLSEEPLPGVRVIAHRLPDRSHSVEVLSGEDGVFSLAGLDPNGRYSCLLAFEDGTAGEAVEAAAGAEDLPLFADPGTVLRVRVLSADGRPIPGGQLWLHHEGTGKTRRAVSDSRGVAVLYRVEPGEHSVRPKKGEPWGTVRAGAGLQEIRAPAERR